MVDIYNFCPNWMTRSVEIIKFYFQNLNNPFRNPNVHMFWNLIFTEIEIFLHQNWSKLKILIFKIGQIQNTSNLCSMLRY